MFSSLSSGLPKAKDFTQTLHTLSQNTKESHSHDISFTTARSEILIIRNPVTFFSPYHPTLTEIQKTKKNLSINPDKKKRPICFRIDKKLL
jgi:hypothetical protein